MPRTIFPPTPAPSMDIVGKVGEPDLPSKDRTSFTLPPPAIVPACNGVAHTKDEGRLQTRTISDYSLPPPPTRARKIIQMTPKMDPSTEMADSGTVTAPAKARRIGSGSSSAARKATKKQPSSTNQAGKRTARKTAHSVIERRRRSKMNEEFGVLKNMIPACKNQEMHKLAILQVHSNHSCTNGGRMLILSTGKY